MAIWAKKRFQILNRDNFQCRYCWLKASDWVQLQVDHINPISKWGDNSVDNLVACCFKCNVWKGTLTIDEYDKITGERVIVIEKINSFITPKAKFMKTFLSETQLKVYKVVWEDCKYFAVLWYCMGYDNEINLKKLQKEIWISPANFSRLKKRLIKTWVIEKDDIQYYLNPAIAIKSEKISNKLWDLFAKKNKELYSIELI